MYNLKHEPETRKEKVKKIYLYILFLLLLKESKSNVKLKQRNPTMKILAFKNDYIKAFDANNIMGLV